MNSIRKIVIALVSVGFIMGLASCSHHTCPTYSKADVKQNEVKA